MQGQKINWPKIRRFYVESKEPWPQSRLAERFACSERSIANHSIKENWVEKRKEYQAKRYPPTAPVPDSEYILDDEIAGNLTILDATITGLYNLMTTLTDTLSDRDMVAVDTESLMRTFPIVANACEKSLKLRSALTGGEDGNKRRPSLASLLMDKGDS